MDDVGRAVPYEPTEPDVMIQQDKSDYPTPPTRRAVDDELLSFLQHVQ